MALVSNSDELSLKDVLYHELQSGSLCGMHALNNLLQGEYVSQWDLGEIAGQLNEAEKLLRNGEEEKVEVDPELRSYLDEIHEFDTGNASLVGNFSVQVLESALTAFNLELVPYASERAAGTRENPLQENGYLCNFLDHWFVIRKIGHSFFKFDSQDSAPKHLSDTYLALYLDQLQQSGYSIFVVRGTFPSCLADELATANPALVELYAKSQRPSKKKTAPPAPSSAATASTSQNSHHNSEEDDDLRRAIQLSLSGAPTHSSSGDAPPTAAAEVALSAKPVATPSTASHTNVERGGSSDASKATGTSLGTSASTVDGVSHSAGSSQSVQVVSSDTGPLESPPSFYNPDDEET